MNINYTRGLIVLIVLGCAIQTSCTKSSKNPAKPSNGETKSGDDKTAAKSNNKPTKKDAKPESEVENMLLGVAETIQKCIDEKTMNNKDFKQKLDNLYKNLVKDKIDIAIKESIAVVNEIETNFKNKQEILKKMESTKDKQNEKKSNTK
ncbi:Hypothetical protein CINCED_3A010780 [Cinara cedri]|uniref:Lipoprotein n=1 Tax=Cinara cedri TaxID=506608 RepID=A0A5E4MKF1_9HEMI|nr:Hypothetical protein CINCED_3A010780 [Cinara cedri]